MLISGRGSNLGALLELRDEIPLRLVVSSSSKAYGLLRARRAGVPTALTPLQPGKKPGTFKIDWEELDRQLRSRRITHLFLAGFMKVVPASFVDKWAGRILNLHPSLLPAYPGLQSIERAYADNAALGLTVHEVTAEVDAGKIILQRRCLKAGEIRSYSRLSPHSLPDFAEFLVHVDEQRAIKEAIRRWKPIRIR